MHAAILADGSRKTLPQRSPAPLCERFRGPDRRRHTPCRLKLSEHRAITRSVAMSTSTCACVYVWVCVFCRSVRMLAFPEKRMTNRTRLNQEPRDQLEGHGNENHCPLARSEVASSLAAAACVVPPTTARWQARDSCWRWAGRLSVLPNSRAPFLASHPCPRRLEVLLCSLGEEVRDAKSWM